MIKKEELNEVLNQMTEFFKGISQNKKAYQSIKHKLYEKYLKRMESQQ